MLLMPLACRQYPDIVLVTVGIGVRWTSGTEGARIRFCGVLPQNLFSDYLTQMADEPGLRIN